MACPTHGATGHRPRRAFPPAIAIAAASMLAMAPPPAAATPARQAALGIVDGLEDEAAIFRWPGSAPDFAGRLALDAGVIDFREGWTAGDALPRTGPGLSLAWRTGANWTAGFGASVRAADSDHAGLHRDGPGASFTWLLARAIGTAQVGATWRSAAGGWSSDADARDEFEHRRDDLGLGARLDLAPSAYLDLAVDARRQANRMQGPGDPPAWDAGERASARSWSARARAFIEIGAGSVLSLAAERLREDFTGPVAGSAWESGAALAHDNRLARAEATLCRLPDPDTMLAATLAWAQASARRAPVAGATTVAAADDRRVLSVAFAAERRTRWWLSLRASLSISRLDRDGGGLQGVERPVNAAAGIGLHLGAWGADLAAGSTPAPAPWNGLDNTGRGRAWLRATMRRDF